MPETIHYKTTIRNRLAEKQRLSRARGGIALLLMAVSGAIMFVFLWIALYHAGRHFDRPVPFVNIIPVQGIAVYTLWKTKSHIMRSELMAAKMCLLLTTLIAALSLILLGNAVFQWSRVLTHLPHLSGENFLLFFVFYTINLIAAIVYLVLLYRMIRKYELHSRNMDRFNRTLIYWTGLTAIHAAFVLAVSL
jgi:hypothetical protein